jgi:hypothetical protein
VCVCVCVCVHVTLPHGSPFGFYNGEDGERLKIVNTNFSAYYLCSFSTGNFATFHERIPTTL